MSNIFNKPDQRQILLDQAKLLREEAAKLPHGNERSRMVSAARKIEAEANVDRWANSAGLQPPAR